MTLKATGKDPNTPASKTFFYSLYPNTLLFQDFVAHGKSRANRSPELSAPSM